MMYQVITEIPGGTTYDVAGSLEEALDIAMDNLMAYGNAKIEEI